MIPLAVSVVIFLVLSGLLAAVDAAVLSVTRPEIEELVQQQRWGAKRLHAVKMHLRDAVVVIVIATNTVNVLGPILVSYHAFGLFDARGVAIVTIVLTLGTIVFSEIIPKAIGNHFAPSVARLASPAILIGQQFLFPLVALAWLTEWLTPGTRPIGTEPQIRSLVRIGHQAGHIQSDEERLIHRAFVLNDRRARDIMTPVASVKAIAASSSITQAAAAIDRSEYSRYPVFGATIDDVQGILLSRDLLRTVLRGKVNQGLLSLTRPPLIVDANDRSDELLALFRDQHLHLAVVQSEGHTLGIVTLEDVLEELVGEIDDEKDVAT